MIILKPTSESQSFKIIPTRGNSISTIVFRNETTNEETTFACPSVASSYFVTCTQFFSFLKEGHFYKANFFYFGTLVHKDRVFCTNQTISTYSVNKDEYITTNDNIIFYE